MVYLRCPRRNVRQAVQTTRPGLDANMWASIQSFFFWFHLRRRGTEPHVAHCLYKIYYSLCISNLMLSLNAELLQWPSHHCVTREMGGWEREVFHAEGR